MIGMVNGFVSFNCRGSFFVFVYRVLYLRPRSFFSVPPYLGLVPIRSIISGIQLAKMA